MKKTTWRIRDIIDLEYLLQEDEGEEGREPAKSVLERDREIYLNQILPREREGGGLTRSAVVRAWLEQRRRLEKRAGHGVLPGEAFEEGYRLTGLGLLMAGILSGLGMAFSFLSYRGTEPLNVSSYLGLFVFTQCLILMFFIGISLVRRLRSRPFDTSVVYTLIRGLMSRLITILLHRAFKDLGGTKRWRLEAVTGLIRGTRRVYGPLFYWPVFILAQIIGVGFNVGVLGATVLKVLGSDVAFGWQSTVQFSAQTVFSLVQTMALPWSWLVPPDIAHPTLLQVEGSHMVLKEGIYHLATGDLVSWWPFLCFSVLTYGLLPRAILLCMGMVLKGRALSRLDFDHRAPRRLIYRMKTPLVTTGGHPAGPGTAGLNHGDLPETGTWRPKAPAAGKGMMVLVPDDIFDNLARNELEAVVSRTFGSPVAQSLRFGVDQEGDEGVLEAISRMKGHDSDLLIVQEAWQPPIREDLDFIRDLRRASGERTMIWVGLIGRPGKDTVFTGVREDDWKAWHQRLKGLGDPYMGLERLGENRG
ncbi:MAG: DUF2868 domain-containing protein [Deltaproteobacteria bacterium]|nr:DUF2868 domain-containing protein [Deltaproteobacteria bacterium]MBW2048432.1 DUF2868 domain-containing protein [Deltaproteobacteria bacterium]MBW2110402.1 DUF2868 domain-containing protein [Deltaproteobacteria bacterium]MBW2351987.1 DUF2868 domain-containing protein [Deltaproteobacteria bacterium]HDZ90966.1 DUF2868 domain-containing protein [Deltaproteobacteria bacterium]